MHLYLSEIPGVLDANSGEVVAIPPGTRFRCRGEVAPNDDPQAFKRAMAQSGYLVVLTDGVVGKSKDGAVPIASAEELGVNNLTLAAATEEE